MRRLNGSPSCCPQQQLQHSAPVDGGGALVACGRGGALVASVGDVVAVVVVFAVFVALLLLVVVVTVVW